MTREATEAEKKAKLGKWKDLFLEGQYIVQDDDQPSDRGTVHGLGGFRAYKE